MKRPAAKPLAKSKGVKKDMENVQRPHPSHAQLCVEPRLLPKGGRAVWYCSDCSGLDVGAMALGRVLKGKGYRHWFASEIDNVFRQVLKACHPNIKKVFADCTKRSRTELLELKEERQRNPQACLIETSGFPCQSFSRQGKQEGSKDKRGQVVYSELNMLDAILPDLILMENVKDLATSAKYKEFFAEVLWLLQSIGRKAYYVDWKVIDSYSHGVPATRCRVYIIAVRKDRLKQPWQWPSELPTVGLDAVLASDVAKTKLDSLCTTHLKNLHDGMKQLKEKGINFRKDPWVLDLAGGFGVSCSQNKFPTITKSHSNSLWLTHKERYATPYEVLRAQGIPATCVACPTGVSSKKLAEMAGNSFTLTVIEQLLKSLLPAIGVSAKK